MLKFKFGVQVDMTSESFIDFNEIGDITRISILSTPRIIAVTNTGATVTLRGAFNIDSETGFLNSKLTGMSVTDFSDALIFSFSGLENITVRNIVFTPESAVLNIINQINAGVNVIGSDFSDVLLGASGNDILKGKAGDDNLKGGPGADELFGYVGNDTLQGHSGQDTLDGGEGSDTYRVSAKENKADLYMDSGLGITDVDILDASSVNILPFRASFSHIKNGLEQIMGAVEGTTLTGLGNSNGVNWDFSGIQLVNIRLKGSLSADTIVGSTSAEVITGLSGKDTVDGGSGNDTLKGGKGADQLYGSTGDDVLSGGAGKDTLDGGPGADTLTGAGGADHFYFENPQEAGDLITDFDRAESDQIILNGGAGTDAFQWGYQGGSDPHARTLGALTSDFLLSANNLTGLTAAVKDAADALFGTAPSSAAYFYGLTTAQHHLYYFAVNNTSALTTYTIATLAGITGVGTGLMQISAPDIILV